MNKEQAYDDKINPLMTQIIEICREHNIAMVASFVIPTEEDGGLFCSTSLPDETDEYPHHLKGMKQVLDAAIIGRSAGPTLMLTIDRADGSKEMIAVLPDRS